MSRESNLKNPSSYACAIFTSMFLTLALLTPAFSQSIVSCQSPVKAGQLRELEDDMYIPAEEKLLDVLAAASHDKDSSKFSDVLTKFWMQNRVYLIRLHTKIKVLSVSENACQIKIASGEDLGLEGWVRPSVLMMPLNSGKSGVQIDCPVMVGQNGKLMATSGYISEDVYNSSAVDGLNNAIKNIDLNKMRMNKTGLRHDFAFESTLISSKKAILLPANTSAKILSKGGMMRLARKVQITSGARKGQLWWVSASAFQKRQ